MWYVKGLLISCFLGNFYGIFKQIFLLITNNLLSRKQLKKMEFWNHGSICILFLFITTFYFSVPRWHMGTRSNFSFFFLQKWNNDMLSCISSTTTIHKIFCLKKCCLFLRKLILILLVNVCFPVSHIFFKKRQMKRKKNAF